MNTDDRDRVRIKHIIETSEEAISFLGNKSLKELLNNRLLTLSLIKEIENIGEAASKISSETKIKFNDIPWIDIIGMRNHLVHVYFDIN